MKQMRMFLIAGLYCIGVAAAHAQGGTTGTGCDTSPENPTLILAAIGSTGAGLAALRTRLRSHKAKK